MNTTPTTIATPTATPTTTTTPTTKHHFCENNGNGICDEINNVLECNYDDGDCTTTTTTTTTTSCEDEWPQKKCKKCNAKKCKKDKKCKKKCKNTCNLCEDGGTSSSEVKDVFKKPFLFFV